MTRFFFPLALLSVLSFAQAPPAAAPAKPARVVPPARIVEFKADKTSIQAGQGVTLTWGTENPSSVNITPQPGRVSPRGTLVMSPTATTTYTLTVTGPNNQVETREVTVNVTGTAAAKAVAAAPATHPDFTGVYGAGGGGGGGRGGAAGGRGGAPAGPELKPGKESYRVVRGPDDPGQFSDCMPLIGPTAFSVPYEFQIVHNANYMLLLHEYPGTFRIIPIESPGSPLAHPEDPDPTWLGDSIGKWEGDTLVVDTIGFNTNTELGGYKHSESLHIVEKFRRPTPQTLEYEITLEDPEVFVGPWTVSRTFALRPDLKKIGEFICENNRDYKNLFAK